MILNMRENASMTEKALALLVFFFTLSLFAQIRFLLRWRKMKKFKGNFPGIVLADIPIEGLLCCAQCGCECLSSVGAIRDYAKQEMEDSDSRKPESKPPIGRRRGYRKRVRQLYKRERERRRIIKLASKKEKTSIDWISKKASVPKERIVEILSRDSDYSIDDAYVLNKKLISKEEQADLFEKIREINIQADKERKLAQGICPRCNNAIEINSEQCTKCGYKLK